MDILTESQRLQHIVDSYSLAGRDSEQFMPQLDRLVQRYSSPLVEWALVDMLVANWLRYPLPRGLDYLQQVEQCLQAWVQANELTPHITPAQFEHVVGLTPPTFQMNSLPQAATNVTRLTQ